jgi:hypothetical protein
MAGLQNSHFWGRGRENTRFDELNCDALCFSCHKYWGGDGREDYIEFKERQLGEHGYKQLKIRAHTYKKKDDKLAILYINQLLKNVSDKTHNRAVRP